MTKFWWGFFYGAVAGIISLFMVALVSTGDTITSATNRGFYTHEGRLYIVTPAKPTAIGEEK